MQRKARPTFEFVKQGIFQRQAERQRLTVSCPASLFSCGFCISSILSETGILALA